MFRVLETRLLEAPRHIAVDSPKHCNGCKKTYEFREAPRHIDFIFWILQPLQGFGAVRHDTITRVWSQISIKVRDSRGRIYDSYTL